MLAFKLKIETIHYYLVACRHCVFWVSFVPCDRRRVVLYEVQCGSEKCISHVSLIPLKNAAQVYNNGQNGIMLHRQCDRALVYGNYAYDNLDAGLSLYESSDCNVYKNKFFSNIRECRKYCCA